MLGHRPRISTSPLKFANYYVWQTYGEVDLRRRWIGSALVKLFSSGELGGGEFPTVGVWSQNRPGMSLLNYSQQLCQIQTVSQIGKLSTSLSSLTRKLVFLFTTPLDVMQLVCVSPASFPTTHRSTEYM